MEEAHFRKVHARVYMIDFIRRFSSFVDFPVIF